MGAPLTRVLAPAAGAVVLALVLAACGTDVFYRPDPAPGELSEPVTPRALAAALLEHLDEGEVVAYGGARQQVGPEEAATPDATGGGAVVEEVVVATVALAGGVEVSAAVALGEPEVRTGSALCAPLADLCSPAEATDDQGRTTAYQVLWQPGVPGGDRGTAGMVLVRDGARVSVTLAGPVVPAGVDWNRLPVGRRVLESVLLDPAVGPRTLPALVAAGEGLGDFLDQPYDLVPGEPPGALGGSGRR